jgi:hypothetical protein
MSNVLFREVQRFSSNLLWSLAIIVPFTGVFAILAYQLTTGKGFGDHPPPNLALTVLLIALGIPSIIGVFTIRLTTIITPEKISFGWNFPSKELNEIRVEDIRDIALIRYRFVGYGFRLTRLYGTVYNVNGDMGIQIVKDDGERLLIGTHHDEELREVIRELRERLKS